MLSCVPGLSPLDANSIFFHARVRRLTASVSRQCRMFPGVGRGAGPLEGHSPDTVRVLKPLAPTTSTLQEKEKLSTRVCLFLTGVPADTDFNGNVRGPASLPSACGSLLFKRRIR